jgi:hypothetical protein
MNKITKLNIYLAEYVKTKNELCLKVFWKSNLFFFFLLFFTVVFEKERSPLIVS